MKDIRTYDDDGEPISANIFKKYGYLFDTVKELYIEDKELSIENALAQSVDYIKATTECDKGQSIDEDDIYDLTIEYLKKDRK